ncbi:MAG: hypothetical protein KIS75_15085 [Chromatiales bacterium]|nr:hypothetical protein [Chromatiales bacterium]
MTPVWLIETRPTHLPDWPGFVLGKKNTFLDILLNGKRENTVLGLLRFQTRLVITTGGTSLCLSGEAQFFHARSLTGRGFGRVMVRTLRGDTAHGTILGNHLDRVIQTPARCKRNVLSVSTAVGYAAFHNKGQPAAAPQSGRTIPAVP